MQNLAQLLQNYHSYHTKLATKVTHYIGVPLIIFSILLFLSWFSFGLNPFVTIPLVWFAIISAGIYYIRLDRQLGIILLITFIIMTLIAGVSWHYELGKSSFIAFLITFIGGWLIQFIGHFLEGQKPAFMDNLLQVFAAPLYITAEVMIKLGKRADLKQTLYPEKEENGNNIS